MYLRSFKKYFKNNVEMGVLITYQTMINIMNYEKIEGLFRVTTDVYTAGLDGDKEFKTSVLL